MTAETFSFPWCSTREDISIDVSITNVGLIFGMRKNLRTGWGGKATYDTWNEDNTMKCNSKLKRR